MASNDLSAMLSQLASFFFVLSRLGPTGSSHSLWHLMFLSLSLASLYHCTHSFFFFFRRGSVSQSEKRLFRITSELRTFVCHGGLVWLMSPPPIRELLSLVFFLL